MTESITGFTFFARRGQTHMAGKKFFTGLDRVRINNLLATIERVTIRDGKVTGIYDILDPRGFLISSDPADVDVTAAFTTVADRCRDLLAATV